MPKVAAQWNFTPLEGVKRVIAVASGKGGVGKSTTAVMLAYAMAAQGKRVGLLDADIYGPSLPRMLGLSGQPEVAEGKMLPMMADVAQGESIACNSMGFLLKEEDAVVWRGPMITKALHQLARGTQWNAQGELDVLIVDMPPGTGDIHLSMVQQVPLDGAVLVTTPQQVAVQDARKCADMFRKVEKSILGVIENMSWFEDGAGNKHTLFGEGGGQKLAELSGCALSAQVPVIQALQEKLDKGEKPDPSEINLYSQTVMEL